MMIDAIEKKIEGAVERAFSKFAKPTPWFDPEQAAAYLGCTADTPNKRRSDTMNTVVATGADEAAAREEAAQLIGAGVASFKAVELTDDTPAFTVEGGWPISFWGQSFFPQHTRGGNKMRARPNVG